MGLFSFLFKNREQKSNKNSEKDQNFQWLDGQKKRPSLKEVTEIEEFFEDDF